MSPPSPSQYVDVDDSGTLAAKVSAVGTVKATGKKYTYESVHNFRFNDDKKVVAHDEFTVSWLFFALGPLGRSLG